MPRFSRIRDYLVALEATTVTFTLTEEESCR